KAPVALRRAFLEFVVALEEIVKSQHEGVVRRALLPAGVEETDQAVPQPRAPSARKVGRQADLGTVAAEELSERLRRYPDAWLAGVEVDEEPKNQAAVRWPARKSVHMEEIVACGQPQLPCRFFLRPKADPVEQPRLRIAW